MARVTVVTGASTGLGVAIAVQAARAGDTVYATMRDPSRREILDAALSGAGVAAHVLALDVAETASVEAAIREVLTAEGRVDVLVNNAGIGFARSTEQASEAEIAGVMNANFMGVVRCVKAVLPRMRAQGSGRIIAVSSIGGLVGQPFNEVYCASKFAVEGYLESLATYVGPAFGLHFTIVEPGGIRSEFAASAMKLMMENGGIRDDPYRPLLQRYLAGFQARAAEGGAGTSQSPEEVAEVVLACMNSASPPIRVRSSAWAEAFCELKTRADPDGTALQRQVTERFLGDLATL